MVDILEPLTREEIREISHRIPDRHLDEGQIFYTPQEKNEWLFMLKKGRVRIYRLSPDGHELTLTVVSAGAVFGEMSLTAQRLENAYAEAQEPVVVCAMQREDLERLIREKPQVGLKIMQTLSERLSQAEDLVEDLALKEVPARLASLILRLVENEGVMNAEGPKILTRYTHRQLAAMIGSKRETVTKAFALLQQAGVVELRRRKIQVLHHESLQRIATTGHLPIPVS